jgi:toxin ParE1/3/4
VPRQLAHLEQPVIEKLLTHLGLQARAPPPAAARGAFRDGLKPPEWQDSRGYIALYRFVADIDAVFVLALRSQREFGYKRDR